ncbi:hypothetical protein BH09PSE3_BH09PSE3_01110 [soil metagenome]
MRISSKIFGTVGAFAAAASFAAPALANSTFVTNPLAGTLTANANLDFTIIVPRMLYFAHRYGGHCPHDDLDDRQYRLRSPRCHAQGRYDFGRVARGPHKIEPSTDALPLPWMLGKALTTITVEVGVQERTVVDIGATLNP